MLKLNFIASLLNPIKICFSVCGPAAKKLIIGTIVVGLIAAANEYIFAFILQDFFSHLNLLKTTTFQYKTPSLEISILILFLAGSLKSVVEGLKTYMARLASQKFAQFTRMNILTIALQNAEQHSSSRIVALFTDETLRASNGILNLSTLLPHATIGLVLLVYCLIFFTSATLFGIAFLTLLVLPYQVFEKKIAKTGLRLSEEWERTNAVLLEGIRNNFYLKLIGRIPDETKTAHNALERHLKLYKKVFMLLSIKMGSPTFMGVIIFIVIGFLQNKYMFFGESFKLLEFFYLFLRFTQATATVGSTILDFKINTDSAGRLKQWYDKNKLDHSKLITKKIIIQDPLKIEVNNLSYSYDEKNLFKDLNFSLKKGDVLTIRGESGVGKSTLLSLILGLLKPTQGSVTLNNSPTYEIQHSMTDLIAYVGPHPFIVEGTILENLKYGLKTNVTEEEIEASLKIASLQDFIESQPQKLQTKMNETGNKFSTGQKQRLMISRALLRKPKILVMDEATANLDPETEHEIIKNLSILTPNIITIIVTHKDAFSSISNQNIHLIR